TGWRSRPYPRKGATSDPTETERVGVNRQRPCPVSGKADWCLVTADAFSLAQEGDTYIITRHRGGNGNLRPQLGRIARKAGASVGEKQFVNMRASCATELAETYPSDVVTKWLGHTEAVAEAHDWQVTEDHFQKAAQNPAQQTTAPSRREQKTDGGGK